MDHSDPAVVADGPLDALYRMAALVESSEDPVIGLTLDGIITDWNPAAERLYGYSAEEALGASIAMLVPPERRGGSGSLLATVRAGETVRQIDTQRMAKDGRRIDVSISMSPIRDEAGAIVGAAALHARHQHAHRGRRAAAPQRGAARRGPGAGVAGKLGVGPRLERGHLVTGALSHPRARP